MADTPGQTLRRIRRSRGKSLTVTADLAGISASYLSRLESGERALDRRSLIVVLAKALEVAPSEITGSALPIPRGRDDDRALTEVRSALMAVSLGESHGEVQPSDWLNSRVAEVLTAQNNCQAGFVGAVLPALIRDLHTTAQARQKEKEVLRLLTLVHMQGTQSWLSAVGAPMDLAWQAITLGRYAAQELDESTALAVSAYGTSLGLLSVGAFDMASRTLTEAAQPSRTSEGLQLTGSLALVSSLVAAAQRDSTQQTSALGQAADIAEHTGEGNAMGFGFGPSNVDVWRMQGALEKGEHAEAARIAEGVNPDTLQVRARQAVYWRDYGRALARLPRQHDRAVTMLRTAERISPEHVQRHPFTQSVLAELLVKAKRDAIGSELRGVAYRAGLPV